MKYSYLIFGFAFFLIVLVSGCRAHHATTQAQQSDSLIYQSVTDRLFRIEIQEMVNETGRKREMEFSQNSYIQVLSNKAIIVLDRYSNSPMGGSYREDEKYTLSDLKINKKREIEFTLAVNGGYSWFSPMVITVYPGSDKCTIRYKRDGNISGTAMVGTFYPYRE